MTTEAVFHPHPPPAPESVKETGLSEGFLSDLALKTVYHAGEMTAQKVADSLTLPFVGVVDQVLELLKHEQFLLVTGGSILGEQALEYKVTDQGSVRAREALLRSQYVGPAPVPLDVYAECMRGQSVADVAIGPEQVEQAFSHLVLDPEVVDGLGPAINSGRSIFIYGVPGSGKTTIAEGIGNVLVGSLMVPHAISVEGHVIKMHDAQYHRPIEAEPPTDGPAPIVRPRPDKRWVRCERPTVIAGGELTLTDLDLVYDPVAKYYEAPLQLRANGGMLLIDDFGRQQVRPVDLLNRWMVPLESRSDFMTLHTGRKVEVPFDTLIVFSTNLEPRDLVDEAFLRRIRHKIEVGVPNAEQIRTIMQRVCKARGVPYSDEGFNHLAQEWYGKHGIQPRGVHPRDIVDQLVDICRYRSIEPALTPELVEAACRSYFVITFF